MYKPFSRFSFFDYLPNKINNIQITPQIVIQIKFANSIILLFYLDKIMELANPKLSQSTIPLKSNFKLIKLNSDFQIDK